MKNRFQNVLLLMLLIAKFGYAQNGLIIRGAVPSSLNGKTLSINIQYNDNAQYKSDSLKQTTVVEDGKFFFKLAAKNPELYKIAIEANPQRVSRSFALEPAETEIVFLDTLFKNCKVVGNSFYNEHGEMNKLTDPRAYGPGEIRALLTPAIEKNVSSPVNVFFLGHFFDQYDQTKDAHFLKMWNMVPDSVKQNAIAKEIRFIADHLMIGTRAADFGIPDTAGKNLNLADLMGKYVLLDFWASWCLPCRAENPSLIETYNKFRDKNFEILSISIDTDRALWLKAIHEDKIGQWKHVSSLNIPSAIDVARRLFKIASIPVNYLIDPDGRIIAKNVWGKDLIKLLRKLN